VPGPSVLKHAVVVREAGADHALLTLNVNQMLMVYKQRSQKHAKSNLALADGQNGANGATALKHAVAVKGVVTESVLEELPVVRVVQEGILKRGIVKKKTALENGDNGQRSGLAMPHAVQASRSRLEPVKEDRQVVQGAEAQDED